MTDPINLNKFRKAKAKAERKRDADRNAVAYGRTKGARGLDKARNKKDADQLDQARRDDT